MKRSSPVRQDERGLYVVTNGAKYRPGKVAGYDHAFDMESGGLVCGDRVAVSNMRYTPLCRVVRQDGHQLVWYSYE